MHQPKYLLSPYFPHPVLESIGPTPTALSTRPAPTFYSRLLSPVRGISPTNPLDVDFPFIVSVFVDNPPVANTQPPIIIRATKAPNIT